MQGWKPLTIPLASGLDESGDMAVASMDAIGFQQMDNVDFGVKGSLRGRPGVVRTTGFAMQTLNTQGGILSGVASPVTLASTGYAPTTLSRYRDRLGERPLLLTAGRAFTYDQTHWADRGAFGSTSVLRSTSTYSWDRGRSGSSRLVTNADFVGCADNFGPANLLDNNTKQTAVLLDSSGFRDQLSSSVSVDPAQGNSARCGAVTALVYVAPGSTNVVMVLRTGDVLTKVTLATNGRDPGSVAGAIPVVCSDYGATNFWVAYIDTSAIPSTRITVLRVDTTGTVLTTGTYTPGGNVTSVWCCNNDNKDRLVVVAGTSTGVHSDVYNATTLVTTAVAIHLTTYVPSTVVCGAAESKVAPGNCWIAYTTADTAAYAVGQGFFIYTRTVTTATSQVAFIMPSTRYAPMFSTGAAFGVNAGGNPDIRIVHQPISSTGATGGRVLMTISYSPGVVYANTVGNTLGTWVTLDLTDQWLGYGNVVLSTGSPSAVGTTITPPIVAQGPIDGTYPPPFPSAAVRLSANTWAFPTLDCNDISAAPPQTTLYTVFATDANKSPLVSVVGDGGSMAMNVCTLGPCQVVSVGDATFMAGSAISTISGGTCRPATFLGYPVIRYASHTGASGSSDSYTLMTVWKYTDENGNTHRSAPSPAHTITGLNTGDTATFSCAAPPPLLGNLGPGGTTFMTGLTVITEWYATDKNPDNEAAHYLVGTGPTFTFTAAAANTASPTLYTDGGGFISTPVGGGGGLAVVGRRVWTSDGLLVYASKLLTPGNAPAWSDVGPLTVTPPQSHGRVVALSTLEDKVVILCERAVYVTAGEGPDDAGNGPDFLEPVKMAEVGCAGPASVVQTSKGVVFWANLPANTDGNVGGLWILTGQGPAVQVSSRLVDEVASNVITAPIVTYVRERELVAVNLTSGILVWDLRTDTWSKWSYPTAVDTTPLCIGGVSGVLWACSAEPLKFSGTRGTDIGAATVAYNMSFRSNEIPANGADGLGWGRVRSVKLLGSIDPALTHTMTMELTYDSVNTLTTGVITVAPPTVTTWPTTRYAPEIMLAQQKCSSLSVYATGSANAVWTALELQVKPGTGRAPAKWRTA